MNKFLNFLLIFIFMFENSIGQAPQDSDVNFIYISKYDNCEGRDITNYTIVGQFKRDRTCSMASNKEMENNPVVISTDSNGQKCASVMEILAISLYEAGAYAQVELISLGTSGPLQGKYLYQKKLQLKVLYLKKCSSVLGYSFVTKKSAVLMISDKLDPNVFIVPTGAFQVFQKSATTICKGSSYIV